MMEPSEREVLDRYRRRYRRADLAIRLFNAALRPFFPDSRSRPVPTPRRILLANYGHLGDVVMSTACISLLKAAFPEAQIGCLIGTWSRPVLEGHPHISRIHLIDHWFMDRSPASRPVKAERYWRECGRVSGELRDAGYDVAIDVRAYMPNSIPLLYRAKIPVRIGYTSVGFGPLLTHPIRFEFHRQHETAVLTDPLRMLGIPDFHFSNLSFSLPPCTEQTRELVDRYLDSIGWSGQRFRIIHVGASVPVRDWPTANWRELARRLVSDGHRLLFTGRGPRDAKLIEPIVSGLSQTAVACDKLDWSGLVEVVRRTELVYSVETMAGHIAVAVGTPCVAIYGGMSDVRQWAPRPGPGVRCVFNVVPCWPCFQYNGCNEMSCLRELPVERVLAAGESLIAGASVPR